VKQVHNRLSQDEAAELGKAYQDGATVEGLAMAFEISRSTVLKFLEQQGIVRRYNLVTGEAVTEAAALYADGWSLAKIAREFGVCASTVHRAFVKAGVATRPRAGRS
jgi:DNA invertase Pin-like site-specific DNA recombinase